MLRLFTRARAPKRIPTVLARNEVPLVLSAIKGTSGLVARLLYGCGLRIHEAVTLRIMDLDFERGVIQIKAGKGAKDRDTMMPESLRIPLKDQVERVRLIHRRDLADGLGGVPLPFAFERKSAHAAREFRWQYLFPSSICSPDRGTGEIVRFQRYGCPGRRSSPPSGDRAADHPMHRFVRVCIGALWPLVSCSRWSDTHVGNSAGFCGGQGIE